VPVAVTHACIDPRSSGTVSYVTAFCTFAPEQCSCRNQDSQTDRGYPLDPFNSAVFLVVRSGAINACLSVTASHKISRLVVVDVVSLPLFLLCDESQIPSFTQPLLALLAVALLALSSRIHLDQCSCWPERERCRQECLSQIKTIRKDARCGVLPNKGIAAEGVRIAVKLSKRVITMTIDPHC
jgi:hypothetical protein